MIVQLIANPVAGARKRSGELRRLIRELAARGISTHMHLTRGPGDAEQTARSVAGKVDAVLVAGGDGSVGEVAHGLIGGSARLVIWPTGTENLVARSLGFKADVDTTAACLTGGRVMPFDLGVANGRSFMVVAGVGFDAEVVHRLARIRSGHISHLSYFGPIWRTFWEHRFPELRVTADGQAPWQGRGMVFVGNLARYALGLPVVRDARPDDGYLDLLILPCANILQLIAHSLRTLARTHVEHPDTVYQRVRNVRVESDHPVPVELDGDAFGHVPLEISIRPAAINLLIPPGAAGRYNAAHDAVA